MRAKTFNFLALIGFAACAAHPALGQATLVGRIDLGAWTGTPVSIVQSPLPVPAPGFSLTSIAFDPVINTIYAADYATTNVYLIDAATASVNAAVYTNGLFTIADIGPTQDVPGAAPTAVMANPKTNRWMFLGERGGAEFSGTTFVEALTPRSMQSGAAWDPVTDDVYAADGLRWFAANNAKFLFAGWGGNTIGLNTATNRVFVAGSGGMAVWDGIALSKANVKIPMPPIASAAIGGQGLAVNPNTNRIYLANATSPTTLDVLDASTYQVVASIPGLPDQSSDFLIAGYMPLSLPRPVLVNTVTNTIFVVNSVASTVSVFDGNTNTLKGTIDIPVPAGSVISQPLPPFTDLFEIKPGNTYYNASTGMITTLAGAISAAVDEPGNRLFVVGVNGTVSILALDPPTQPTSYSVNGVLRDSLGVPVAGVTLRATGSAGSASAITDSTGLFVLTGLPTGTYTITPKSTAFAFSPSSRIVSVNGQNLGGLTFQANPPIVPSSYTLNPWTMIGAGVTTTAMVTLNSPAPSGGAVVTLSSSDPKAAKFPATVTVPGGQTMASFPVQGNGVSSTTTVSLIATYNGGTATASLTVAPGDSLKITAATYSQSTHLLTVNATGTNPAATLQVQNANNNVILGTMTNLGNGSYSFKQSIASSVPTSVPTSVNVISNLGGKTGQGVTLIP